MTDSDELALAQAWLRRHGFTLTDAQVIDPARLAANASTIAGQTAACLPFGAEPSHFTAVLESLARGD